MLVVKAYNARDEDETLAEQFSKVAITTEVYFVVAFYVTLRSLW
jgi:hypothetical protein